MADESWIVRALANTTEASDTFGRTATDAWGNATSGQAWSVSGGTAANYDVSGGKGLMALASTGTQREATLAVSLADVDIAATVALGLVPGGAAISLGMEARRASSAEHIRSEVTVATDGQVTCRVQIIVGGSPVTVGPTTLVLDLVVGSGTVLGHRLRVVGARIQARVWDTAGAEPETWHADLGDRDISAAGGIALWARREASNTDAGAVASWDSVVVSDTWTVMTERVSGTLTIQWGRPGERDDDPHGRMSGGAENQDHALIVGNPSSLFYPWWQQGLELSVQDVADGTTFDLGHFFLLPQDLAEWSGEDVAQMVPLAAVDRLGWLDQAPALTSALGEFAAAQAREHLVDLWPLSDRPADLAFRSLLTGAALRVRRQANSGPGAGLQLRDMVSYGGQAGPPADDGSYVSLTPSPSPVQWPYLDTGPLDLTVPDGASLTVSVWANIDSDFATLTPSGGTIFSVYYDGDTELIEAVYAPGYDDGYLVVGSEFANFAHDSYVQSDRWTLVTFQLDTGTGDMRLWVGSSIEMTSTGGPTGAMPISKIQFGNVFAGALGLAQVRVHPPTEYLRAEHLAQHAFGYTGGHRQTVAERLEMIADWAGISPADMDFHASASVPCAAVSVAGSRPSAALRSTIDVEGGGRLFCGGNGWLRAVGRSERYNQAVSLEIPWSWVERPVQIREDPRITDAIATSPDGGVGRRVDPVRIRSYGDVEARATIASAVAADLGNWAQWTLDHRNQVRLRCPQLRFSLLHLSQAARAALLALEQGQRIQLTGTPTGWPAALCHLIVEGMTHQLSTVTGRWLTLNTSPLLGESVGAAPVCAKVGDLVADDLLIAY